MPSSHESRKAPVASDGTTESFLHALPKVELHLHLEGSIEPQTLRKLARAKRRLQKETEEWINQQEGRGFRYGNFAKFLNAFKQVTLLLESPADYALITTRLLERLTAQNVHYAEITLSAGVILWKKQPLPEIFEAVAKAAQKFAPRLRVKWIFDAVRQFGEDHAREVLGWARIFRDEGVAAFGIGGDEARGPAEIFTTVYREAKDLGLRVTAHAGESAGPESVRDAVELLGAERIGHGLAAARDPQVMALLRERRVPLEVCLTSNVATGLIVRVEDHPLRQFLDAGLQITLSTDDPAMFSTTLERELTLAYYAFSLSRGEITSVMINSILASFDSEDGKQLLLRKFEKSLRADSKHRVVS
ncbi:MAG TPA: adenosine deaminase [Terriglobia bacterium]|nr:adenosine deaminase [Terriglobia bacterium]